MGGTALTAIEATTEIEAIEAEGFFAEFIHLGSFQMHEGKLRVLIVFLQVLFFDLRLKISVLEK